MPHTLGPWRLAFDSEFDSSEIESADGVSLMGSETFYPWVPENPADWHLIAAGPEMLEALEEACDHYEKTRQERAPWRPIIAKAKGETDD